MNINLLKLADRKLSGSKERFFISQQDDSQFLFVYAESLWHKPKIKPSQIRWDVLEKIHADIPFPGYLVTKSHLKRSEVVDWIKEHLNYGKEV